MAVATPSIVKLSAITLNTDFGTKHFACTRKHATVILGRPVPPRWSWLRAFVAWGLARSSLHGWALGTSMTPRSTWHARASFRGFTARAGTLSTHTVVVCVPTSGYSEWPHGTRGRCSLATRSPNVTAVSCGYVWTLEEPTCVATTRLCPSHRAPRIWWNRRRYARRPWSAGSAAEMPRSCPRRRRARPRSPVQPRVEGRAQIGPQAPLHARRISPVWVL